MDSGVLLLNASHHHAHVPAFGGDANPAWLESLHERVRYLLGQPFLKLWSMRKLLNNTRAFSRIAHSHPRDETDMDLPEEWQQVMFAKAYEPQVTDDHNPLLVAVLGRDLEADRFYFLNGEHFQEVCDMGGRRNQSFLRRVFPKLDQQISDNLFYAEAIHGAPQDTGLLIKARNSLLVASEDLKLPSTEEVTTIAFCFSTPRIIRER